MQIIPEVSSQNKSKERGTGSTVQVTPSAILAKYSKWPDRPAVNVEAVTRIGKTGFPSRVASVSVAGEDVASVEQVTEWLTALHTKSGDVLILANPADYVAKWIVSAQGRSGTDLTQ